ncbi:MAG: RnfABCDGE type electron transport complex subunit G [Gammaproteobacteria bacterium]|nr:RnfABCDGE type electron transport complex subunit G [Gammaproteobacteria bacterium]
MNTAKATADRVSPTRLVLVLGSIAMLSGLLVVTTVELTAERIAENKRHAIEKAVFQVIPGAQSRRDFSVIDKTVSIAAENNNAAATIYAGYDESGQLKGIAAEAVAVGYQDKIHVLYGYSPDCQCITGIRVLKMAETPGLGDKINTDPAFLENFRALDAQLNDSADALRNAIVTVKHGRKRNAWQIDAISGATISSNAVGHMLNNSAQTLLPVLMPQLDKLREPANEP